MQKTIDLQQVNTLVFKGGGASGLVYLGSILELEKHIDLQQINTFAGTSAGAITAMLLALGLDTASLTEIVLDVDFSEWLDHQWGIVRDIHNLRTNFGYCQSDVPKAWLTEQVKEHTGRADTTFRDLQNEGRNLVVPAFNWNREVPVYFGLDGWTLDTPIVDAVLASMSIQFVWEPVYIATQGADGFWTHDLYFDGGNVDNYPVGLWDLESYANPHVLGFWVDSQNRIDYIKSRGTRIPERKPNPKNFLDYAQGAATAPTNAEAVAQAIEGRDSFRTVFIPTKVGLLQFEMSESEKLAAMQEGRVAVQKFLKRQKSESGSGKELDL